MAFQSVCRALLLVALLAWPAVAQQEPGATGDPPTLVSISYGQGAYRAGDRVDVFVEARDNQTVLDVAVSLRDPEGKTRVITDCDTDKNLDGSAKVQARTTCHFPTKRTDPHGTYKVQTVRVLNGTGYDHVLELGTDYEDAGQVKATFVLDRAPADITPPKLAALTITPANATGGDVVNVTLTVQDETGLRAAEVVLDDPGDATYTAPCLVSGADADCGFTLPEDAIGGVYTVFRMHLTDGAGNEALLFRGRDFVANETIHPRLQVTQKFIDKSAPVLGSYTIPSTVVQRGDDVAIEVNARDDGEFAAMMVRFDSMTADDGIVLDDCAPLGSGDVAATCTGTLPDDFPLGRARVKWFFFADKAGNQEYFPVGEPPRESPKYEELLDSIGFFVAPDTLRTTGGSGEGLVGGLSPSVDRVKPGSVLRIHVQHGPAAALDEVRFAFNHGSGAILGVDGCTAKHNPEPGGFHCLMVIPAGWQVGEHVLSTLRAKPVSGAWQQVDFDGPFAPRFTVARNGTELPFVEVPPGTVVDGITARSFNAPAETTPTMTATASTTAPPPAEDSPALWVGCAVLAALALARRRT